LSTAVFLWARLQDANQATTSTTEGEVQKEKKNYFLGDYPNWGFCTKFLIFDPVSIAELQKIFK